MDKNIPIITNDSVFTGRIGPFISAHIDVLEAYDKLRPEGHPYEFHLHSRRVADNAKALALALGWSEDEAISLYWATLAHDFGKMRLPVDLWDSEGKPTPQIKAARRSHTLTGFRFIEEEFNDIAHHPFIAFMAEITLRHHEFIDGSGYLGLKGDEMSLPVRIVSIVDAFDGWSTWRPHFKDRDISPQGVITRMRTEKAGKFDEEIMDVFEKLVLESDKLCFPLKAS